jgi:hypothetical protein
MGEDPTDDGKSYHDCQTALGIVRYTSPGVSSALLNVVLTSSHVLSVAGDIVNKY